MALDIFDLSNSNDKQSISWQKLADRWKPNHFKKAYQVILLKELPIYITKMINKELFGRFVVKLID